MGPPQKKTALTSKSLVAAPQKSTPTTTSKSATATKETPPTTNSAPAPALATPLEPASEPAGRVTRSATKMALPMTKKEKALASKQPKVKERTPEEYQRIGRKLWKWHSDQLAKDRAEAPEPSGPRTHRWVPRQVISNVDPKLQAPIKTVGLWGGVKYVLDERKSYETQYFLEPIPDNENPAIAEAKDPGGWIAYGERMGKRIQEELRPSDEKKRAVAKQYQKMNRDLSVETIQRFIEDRIALSWGFPPFVIQQEATCPMLFRKFNKLSPHIRRLIWEFATPEQARAVSITQHGGVYANTKGPDVFTVESWDQIPPLLMVNRESRNIAKQQYTLAFEAVDRRPQWFNFGLDALHLWAVDPRFVDKMPSIRKDLRKVQNLAIHGSGLHSDYDHYERLRHFHNLQTMLIEIPSKSFSKVARLDFEMEILDSVDYWIEEVRKRMAQKFRDMETNAAEWEIHAARSKAVREKKIKAGAEEMARKKAEIHKEIAKRSRFSMGKKVRFVDEDTTKTAIKDRNNRVGKKSSTPHAVRDGTMVLKNLHNGSKPAVPKTADDPMDVDNPYQQQMAMVSSPTTALPKKVPKEFSMLNYTRKSEIAAMIIPPRKAVFPYSAAVMPKEHSTENQLFQPAKDPQVEATPNINSLIDSAIAEMPDVDVMTDEAMADISSTEAPLVQVKQGEAVNSSMINAQDANTTSAAASQEDAPVQHEDTVMAEREVYDQVLPEASGSSNMEVDSQALTSTTNRGEKLIAVNKSHADILSRTGDFNRKSAARAIAHGLTVKDINVLGYSSLQQSSHMVVYQVAKERMLQVVFSKAEDILEVVADAREWPLRYDTEKRYWKWNMSKARAAKYQVGFPKTPEEWARNLPCNYKPGIMQRTSGRVEDKSAAPVGDPSSIDQPSATEMIGAQIWAERCKANGMPPPTSRPQDAMPEYFVLDRFSLQKNLPFLLQLQAAQTPAIQEPEIAPDASQSITSKVAGALPSDEAPFIGPLTATQTLIKESDDYQAYLTQLGQQCNELSFSPPRRRRKARPAGPLPTGRAPYGETTPASRSSARNISGGNASVGTTPFRPQRKPLPAGPLPIGRAPYGETTPASRSSARNTSGENASVGLQSDGNAIAGNPFGRIRSGGDKSGGDTADGNTTAGNTFGRLQSGGNASGGKTTVGSPFGSFQSVRPASVEPKALDLAKAKRLPKIGTFYTQPQPKGPLFAQHQNKDKITISTAGARHYVRAKDGATAMAQQAPAPAQAHALVPALFNDSAYRAASAPPPAPYVSPYPHVSVPMSTLPVPPQNRLYVSPYAHVNPVGGIAGGTAGTGAVAVAGTAPVAGVATGSVAGTGATSGPGSGVGTGAASVTGPSSGTGAVSPAEAIGQANPGSDSGNKSGETVSDIEGDTIGVESVDA